jgi:alkanesulfonate monooxygenase SsuD/methylene tetrahydromethanopterin reductase-like flavin-dependent oxidoreductase (luciferase family)
VKIGVAMRLLEDAAETVADARALEAAGADSLWVVDHGDQDPWVLGAALAAVTWRVRLVIAGAVDRRESRETLERISRGRLAIGARTGDEVAVADAEGVTERWSVAAMPADRAAWAALRAERESQGFAGIVLPNGPRLLDLIRNADVVDDRSDVKLAFG